MEDLDFVRCGRFHGTSSGGGDVKTALLGREPRYAPDRDFDTLHVSLSLRIDFRRRRVEGVARTRIVPFNEGLTALAFDAAGMRILGVRLNGLPARHRHLGKRLTVRTRRALPASEEAEVEIRYRIEDPRVGLHFVPGAAGARRKPKAVQVWSQGQPEDSRYWFPCHDAPHEKATSEVIATVPAGFTAVSNGTLVEAAANPGGREVTWHWRMDQPHSLYLVMLAAGRFGKVVDRWEHVPLTLWCDKGREADARRGLGKTAKAMDFFSRSLGVPYPYGKYDQVIVSQYPGGMENTTATTMTDACLIDKRAALDNDVDSLMAHELAHQWFGDLLTCRDWSHAWLNEGFATYYEALFTRHDMGRDEFDYEIHRYRQAYFHEDKDRYRRPIVCAHYKNPWVLFDRHLYEKGACVLHMLRGKLGDALWRKAMGHYVRKHRDRTVETDDLIEAIGEATGRNLRPFFQQWVYKAGYPQFKVRLKRLGSPRAVELWVLQTQPVSEEAPLFKTEVGIRFAGRGWTRDFKRRVEEKEHRWAFDLPGEPLNAEFDPEHWLLKSLDFKKPFAMWAYQLRRAPGALSRIQASHEVARWGSAEATELLSQALGRESFWGAAAEMASDLGSVRTRAAFEALQGFVRHPHPKVRRAVAGALGEFRGPETARALLRMLDRDPSLNVQAEAARSLGDLREPRWAPRIRRKLAERSYRDILQGGALQGLSNLKDPRVLPVLRRAAGPSNSYPGRAWAIDALGRFASVDGTVIGWISGYVEDPDERVALAAVHALGRTEDERALPALKRARERSPSCRVQTHAEEAIARITAGSDGKSA